MTALPAFLFLGAYAIVLLAIAAGLTCLVINAWLDLLDRIKQSRRSARLSLIARKMLDTIERDQRYSPEITDTIRQALEQ
jgi:hypothetical protein